MPERAGFRSFRGMPAASLQARKQRENAYFKPFCRIITLTFQIQAFIIIKRLFLYV